MAKSFNALRAKMSPESRARAQDETEAMLREMPLHELRAALDLTQEELASVLNVNQASISKLERRTDMYFSTLGRFIHAMGGELEVRARFPSGIVKITSLKAIEPEARDSMALSDSDELDPPRAAQA